MKTAIAFLTKDRVELSKQSIQPLLQPDKFDLFWCDGSTSDEGLSFLQTYGGNPSDPRYHLFANVRGGAGAAIVFALTTMLNEMEYIDHGPAGFTAKPKYDYVGLVENDVVLPVDWFTPTMDLFSHGKSEGLTVGAVSTRTYQDRVLFQRDGFGVMHNIGAGMIVFSRAAAAIVLNSFRSGWTADNRRIFCQLSGVDIGPFWAFRNDDHALVADWHFDATLAAHGYASLALTLSHVEMIGQHPPLVEQGLVIAGKPVEERIDNTGFERYRESLAAIRDGRLTVNVETTFSYSPEMGGWNYLPHQLHMIGGKYSGDWRFRETRGNGEFGWVSSNGIDVDDVSSLAQASFIVPVYGLASLLFSGGKQGGQIEVTDEYSGYSVSPFVPFEGEQMQALQIPLPGGVIQRNIRVIVLSPGICFLRLTCQNKQPHDPTQTFDHSVLPVPV